MPDECRPPKGTRKGDFVSLYNTRFPDDWVEWLWMGIGWKPGRNANTEFSTERMAEAGWRIAEVPHD